MADGDAPGGTPGPPHPRRSDEQRGCDDAAPSSSLYVVEQPDPAGPHYDFRLTLGAVSASWAIPEHPSLIPGDKRLAIRTPAQDRSGAAVWDHGTVDNLGDLPWDRALAEGRLSLRLTGHRLRGVFVLVRAHRSPDQEQWLLITREVSDGSPARGEAVVTAYPRPSGPPR
ncbi:DNA polymerase ligase N-terminal domain-containing protein [Saccharomonospora piscinae]|nr:DNA polymerase ligase N-terminal domain-containing protein [Saccharomonospora piscinae]